LAQRPKPTCARHWKQIPDDIRERIRWSMDEGASEYHAALAAAEDAILE
jgi:hypothetical protein